IPKGSCLIVDNRGKIKESLFSPKGARVSPHGEPPNSDESRARGGTPNWNLLENENRFKVVFLFEERMGRRS
ncbi:MAG TPA: hypothetical protein VH255_00095, partial [Verrucomicrobiae bacterium]|nr:hypothetical protein [Verrucomicrobiae bacterium]